MVDPAAIPLLVNAAGDELVQVTVEIPRKLNRRQEEILREFAETEDKNVAPESKSFLDRLIKYFAGDDIA